MKRNGFLRAALPALLSVAVLAAGGLAPRFFLTLQQRSFRRDIVSVAAGDIHPYGEEYETMKQTLLTAVRSAEDAALYSDDCLDISEEQRDLLGRGMAAAQSFLSSWDRAAPELGLLDGWPETAERWCLVTGAEEDVPILLLEETSGENGRYWAMEFDPQTGALLGCSLDLHGIELDAEAASAVWSGLRQAYVEQCGLSFEDVPMASAPAEGISTNDARSLDLTFRLVFYMAVFDGGGYLSVSLHDNH